MENGVMLEPRKTPSNKVVWLVILVIALVCATSVVIYHEHDKITEFINPEEVTETTDTIYNAQESVPTIQEVLEFRREVLEGQRIDSVFLTMPDVILIDILMNHGTSLSNKDIVYIYESNKTTYNKVKDGAKAQRYKDSIVIEDSIRGPLWNLFLKLNILSYILSVKIRYNVFRK